MPVFSLLVLAVGIVIVLMGFSFDKDRSFLGNIVAEIAGIFISIFISLWVVDSYLEYKRVQQWSKVEDITLNAIATHLCEIAGQIFVSFPGLDDRAFASVWNGHGQPPNDDVVQGFDEILDEMQNIGGTKDYDRKSPSDFAIDHYKMVKWDLDQVQDVLTPRVLQSPASQTIIDSLIDFDNAHRELRHSIIADQQVVIGAAFPALVSLIRSAKRLYQAMVEHHETF